MKPELEIARAHRRLTGARVPIVDDDQQPLGLALRIAVLVGERDEAMRKQAAEAKHGDVCAAREGTTRRAQA
jgi:hypothetical protein